MVALVQRVRSASVSVDDSVVGSIDRGLLILLGVHRLDSEAEAEWLARKCANLRIFPDEEGRMNRSLPDVSGSALVVSQFTLYGDASRGNRPSFIESADPEKGKELYEYFISQLRSHISHAVRTGIFGAMMDVSLVNWGPVTLWVEKKPQEV